MDSLRYFKSLSLELNSLKDRIRYIIDDRHWLTDGEWKETVLRAMLRRNLPPTAIVGRGFIITRQQASSQVDILVYDGAKPVLFREGDLALITPDAAQIVIEVKTRITPSRLTNVLTKLADNAEQCRVHPGRGIMFSLFAYESDRITAPLVLSTLQQVAAGNQCRIIDRIALGPHLFFRYWRMDPLERTRRPYDRWHAYNVPNLAPGYFIHNIIEQMNPESVNLNNYAWFPPQGKEPFFAGDMEFVPNR